MIKCFCDICQKETDYEQKIDVSGGYKIQRHTYCIECFQKQKNWNLIHHDTLRRDSARNLGNRSGVTNVTPAQAGVQSPKILDSRFRGNNKRG